MTCTYFFLIYLQEQYSLTHNTHRVLGKYPHESKKCHPYIFNNSM